MVDRLVKIDSGMNRVLETRDDQGRGGGQQPDDDEKDKKKKDKDKFDKGNKPFWKRLVSASDGPTNPSIRSRLAAGEKPNALQLRQDALLGRPPEGVNPEDEVTNSEEMSVTLSRRVLLVWGVVDIDGRPRIPVIITYAVVAAVIVISTFLIFGILFRRT